MRILILNQYFFPDRSATSQLLTELCEDLARDHEVVVVTGRPSYNPVAHTRSQGLISRERVGDVQVRRVWSTSFDRSSMLRRLANYGSYLCTSVLGALTVKKPDVILALTDPPPIGLIGAGTAALRRIPLILIVNDLFPEVAVALGTLRQPLTIAVLRRGARLLYRSASYVVSIGEDMTARLRQLGVPAAKLRTIHYWAVDTAWDSPEEAVRFRRKMGWEDRFVVMHSGNVGLSQDLDTVLDAAHLLRNEPSILFVITGEGAAKSRLVADAERQQLKNVVFLPFQPKSDLAASLGAADVHLVGLKRGLAGYIVPSKLYGIMAAGKPIIAAVEEGADAARIIQEHQCGMRIDPGDGVALAKAVSTMRTAPLREMGARGRRALYAQYSLPQASAAYRTLLYDSQRARSA